MSNNILITGATGFIGSYLVNIFLQNNKVYNLGRNIDNMCENIYWNLDDNLISDTLPLNIDTVIHSAAIVGESNYSKNEYIKINLFSTLKLLEYCISSGVEHFIYISTGGVYGFSNVPFSEKDIPNPQGIYNISKYLSEELCKQYSDKLCITIIRPFFPYGKGQTNRLISNLIVQIKSGKKIVLNNNGFPLINPIYIEDLCNIVKEVVDKRLEGIFNLCGDETISIKELCELINQKVQTYNLQIDFNGKNTENLLGNNEKIQRIFNNCIKTKISEGIEKTII